MGKYGYQQRWGQKDSAKEGGSKTDNAHGAPTKKTERLRGADATSGGSDATTLSKMTPMQGLLGIRTKFPKWELEALTPLEK